MNFQEEYARLSDDALLAIAADRRDLLPEAALAMDTEMAHRGLTYEQARVKKKQVARLEFHEGRRRGRRKPSKYFVARINGWMILAIIVVPAALALSLEGFHLVSESWGFAILTAGMGILIAIAGVQPWLRRSLTFWISLPVAIAVQLLLGRWISAHVSLRGRNSMKGAGFLTLAVGYAVGWAIFLLLQKLRPSEEPQGEPAQAASRR